MTRGSAMRPSWGSRYGLSRSIVANSAASGRKTKDPASEGNRVPLPPQIVVQPSIHTADIVRGRVGREAPGEFLRNLGQERLPELLGVAVADWDRAARLRVLGHVSSV